MSNYYKNHKGSTAFKLLIAVAIAINIVQFKTIERQTHHMYMAANRYDTDNIVDIGLAYNNAIRQYYMNWFALREIAPNSTIFISRDSRFGDNYSYERQITAMGKAKRIETIDIDSSRIIDNINPIDHMVAFGEDSAEGRKGSMYPHFVIAMNHNSNVEFEKLGSDVIQINKSRPIRNGAKFVLIDWGGLEKPLRPIERVEPFMYSLLVEVSLLPKEVQEELPI